MYAITKSQQYRRKNVSGAMAMITPGRGNDTYMGFNTFHIIMTKNIVHQILTHAKCFGMVVK